VFDSCCGMQGADPVLVQQVTQQVMMAMSCLTGVGGMPSYHNPPDDPATDASDGGLSAGVKRKFTAPLSTSVNNVAAAVYPLSSSSSPLVTQE
jgi:hypothetical protein